MAQTRVRFQETYFSWPDQLRRFLICVSHCISCFVCVPPSQVSVMLRNWFFVVQETLSKSFCKIVCRIQRNTRGDSFIQFLGSIGVSNYGRVFIPPCKCCLKLYAFPSLSPLAVDQVEKGSRRPSVQSNKEGEPIASGSQSIVQERRFMAVC